MTGLDFIHKSESATRSRIISVVKQKAYSEILTAEGLVFEISIGIGSLPPRNAIQCTYRLNEKDIHFWDRINKSYGIDIITNDVINN